MNYFNYFTEVEDTFIRRRGRHLLLSPMDWALIESWKEMGVPLHVVLRGVEQSFDSYEKKPRRRSVKTLLYCQEEVEAQFAEWRDAQVGATTAMTANATANGHSDAPSSASTKAKDAEAERERGLPFPRPAILEHLAACVTSLRRAHTDAAGKGAAEVCEALTRAAERLEALAADFANAARPDAEKLEASLTDLEQLLDRSLREHAAPARLDAVRRVAEEQLRPYRARMEPATYEQTFDNLTAKQLRDEHGLPRLSLFYL